MRSSGSLRPFYFRSFRHFRSANPRALHLFVSVLIFCLSATLLFSDDRTILRPGLNFFSPQQDIELGKRAAAQVPKQFPLLNDKRVDDYLQALGMKLAAHAPFYKYPYRYRCVNTEVLNAFALPGGFVYVNRGIIEQADNEGQLAAVMAHETSHVALRHGTNQASKAYGAQIGLGLLGALVGGNAVASIVTQIFGSVGVPLAFLKMSREDETQADVLGTQILHDAGYDPQAMADFFEKLQKLAPQQSAEFLSDHPNPEHRIDRIEEEIDRLGGAPPHAVHDSPEFESIKRYVKSLPPAPKSPQARSQDGAPEPPSTEYKAYSSPRGQDAFSVVYPDNWTPVAQEQGVLLAPQGGAVAGEKSSGLAWGVIVSSFAPQSANSANADLRQATDQLIAQLEKSNAAMKLKERGDSETLGGSHAASVHLENDSPAGGRESDWLVAALRPDGKLFYVLCVSPQKDYGAYSSAFRAIVHSVKFED